ncbi:MAG: hypothetical protein GY950_09155 [bacterium]|nr:hypothetical protein [bacterium]
MDFVSGSLPAELVAVNGPNKTDGYDQGKNNTYLYVSYYMVVDFMESVKF